MNKTIAAIATPLGNGGVGIIRLSGKESLAIISKCFDSKTPIKPRYAIYGTITITEKPSEKKQPLLINEQKFTDNIIVLYFPGPNSFTGEDVVEIHAHGGAFLLQKILEHLFTIGTTPATPGEFSKRAFFNGKISLDQAEAIMEKIAAESESHLTTASAVYQGNLKNQLFSMEKALVSCLAHIEATLDHPDHDIEHTTIVQIKPQIGNVIDQIERLAMTADQGRMISSGIQVAVIGKPNVGKSSLFNALLNKDRSIVTDIAGTTTDTVSESILYNGMKIVFNDTAGIREINCTTCSPTASKTTQKTTASQIEAIGIRRTYKLLEESDVILAIFDGSAPPTKEDSTIIKLLEKLGKTKNTPLLVALNKSDLASHKANLAAWTKATNTISGPLHILKTSAIVHKNIEELKSTVYSTVIAKLQKDAAIGPANTQRPDKQLVIITNTRHLNELNQAKNSLTQVLQNIDTLSMDMIATDITMALFHLANISGTSPTDAIIDEVFSKFCLGK